MGKKISIAILALLLGACWLLFIQSGKKAENLEKQIYELSEQGDREEKIPVLKQEIQELEGQRMLNGILLVFLAIIVVGVLFVSFVLPMLADKMSESVFGGSEEIEEDPMRDARVLMARGNWSEAIEAFHVAASNQELNRMPYIEIVKIQRNHLEDPAAAIETLRKALESHVWPEEDLVYLMSYLADIYDTSMDDRGAAVILFEQIIELFPDTRHSASAHAKLRSWGMA